MLGILSRQRILKPKAPAGRICISCSVSAVIIKEVYGACVQLIWMLAWVLNSSTSSGPEQNSLYLLCLLFLLALLSVSSLIPPEQFLHVYSRAQGREAQTPHPGAMLSPWLHAPHKPHYCRYSTKVRVKKTDIVCKRNMSFLLG